MIGIGVGMSWSCHHVDAVFDNRASVSRHDPVEESLGPDLLYRPGSDISYLKTCERAEAHATTRSARCGAVRVVDVVLRDGDLELVGHIAHIAVESLQR